MRLREQYLELVASELKRIRKEQKLTTRELADKVGLHQLQIVRVETKKHELPLNNLEAILDALGYKVELQIKFVKKSQD